MEEQNLFNIEEETKRLTATLTYLRGFAKPITDKHIQRRGAVPWPTSEQIAKMHEEVSEVWNALRKKEGLDSVTHELIDVIMTCATMMILLEDTNETKGITKEMIEREANNVIHKLWKREGILS